MKEKQRKEEKEKNLKEDASPSISFEERIFAGR